MDNGAPTIRVLAIDDHPVLRDGIVAMLGADPRFDVVGTSSNAEAGLEAYAELRPDITLMDLQMPGMGGLKGIQALRQRWPFARVVVLTTYRGDANAGEALSLGATGYLLKSALREELVECLVRVHNGGRFVSAEVCTDIASHVGDERLTPQESKVLALLAEGMDNRRIAVSLGVSVETVKTHLSALFGKLGASNRTEAIRIGIRRGMLMNLDR